MCWIGTYSRIFAYKNGQSPNGINNILISLSSFYSNTKKALWAAGNSGVNSSSSSITASSTTLAHSNSIWMYNNNIISIVFAANRFQLDVLFFEQNSCWMRILFRINSFENLINSLINIHIYKCIYIIIVYIYNFVYIFIYMAGEPK